MVIPVVPVNVPVVPFYSQFIDIASSYWQKQGCGITSLAMIIDYYNATSSTPSVNALLSQGIAAGAYDYSTGWIHSGLIKLAEKYGLDGVSYDLSGLDKITALKRFTAYVDDGPVMASIHYKFDPKSSIPHVVVIDAIENGIVYYNDPAAKSGEKQVSVDTFQKAWKKKFIVIRPDQEASTLTTPHTVPVV